jgi:hypothetical protein
MGVAVAIGAIFYFGIFVPHSRVNSGFGPEWDCSTPKPGVPVCTKKPAENSKPN